MNRPGPYRLALITGGSSGIGLATAEKLAAEGTNLILVARREELLERAREACLSVSEKGVTVRILPLDISDGAAMKEKIGKLFAQEDGPDLLINAAGIAKCDYFENHSNIDLDRIIDINLKGCWHVLGVVVPLMRRSGGGIIMNVASSLGFVGFFGYSAYTASKFGITGLSEVLRAELKPQGITVKVFFPCDTDTPQLAVDLSTRPPETQKTMKAGKVYSPQAMADFLLKGLRSRRFATVPDFMNKLLYILSRWAPWLIRLILDSDIKKVREKGESRLFS